MDRNKEVMYKRQLIKIYVSFALCPLWFIVFFLLQNLFPGTFQEQLIIGKFSIIALLVTGIAYVYFLINFLSKEKNVTCMNYYSKRRKERNKE